MAKKSIIPVPGVRKSTPVNATQAAAAMMDNLAIKAFVAECRREFFIVPPDADPPAEKLVAKARRFASNIVDGAGTGVTGLSNAEGWAEHRDHLAASITDSLLARVLRSEIKPFAPELIGHIEEVQFDLPDGPVTMMNVSIGPLTDIDALCAEVKEKARRLYGQPRRGRRRGSEMDSFVEDQLDFIKGEPEKVRPENEAEYITGMWILANREIYQMGREGMTAYELRTLSGAIGKSINRINLRKS